MGFHKQFGDIITGNTPVKSVVLYEMNENKIFSELYGFHSSLKTEHCISI